MKPALFIIAVAWTLVLTSPFASSEEHNQEPQLAPNHFVGPQSMRFLQEPKVHVKARETGPGYPARVKVTDDQVNWNTSFPNYAPTVYLAAGLLGRKGTDPQDVTKIEKLGERQSYEGFKVDPASGLPLNPRGRTGMTGRGRLWLWGPNHAADPIVTRINPETKKLEFVAIKRKDSGDKEEWAIPGGMVDPGEKVTDTLRREFEEEAGNVAEEHRAELKKNLDELFKSENVVYKGYIDDPRNTDNAWMESCAYVFHCPPKLATALKLHAGDDAAQVRWLEITDSMKLYASHKDLVLKAVEILKEKGIIPKI